MNYLVAIFVLCIMSTACSQKTSFEGLLTYRTSDHYVGQSRDTVNYIRYYVKGSKIVTVSGSNFGGQRYIRDTEKQTGTLLLLFNNQKFALLQDLTKDTIQKKFIVEKQKGKNVIGGVKSQRFLVSGEYLQEPMVVFSSKKYPHIVPAYESVPGLPTKYTLIIDDQAEDFELVSIEAKPIPEELFEIPMDYQVMTMEEFLDNVAGMQ